LRVILAHPKRDPRSQFAPIAERVLEPLDTCTESVLLAPKGSDATPTKRRWNSWESDIPGGEPRVSRACRLSLPLSRLTSSTSTARTWRPYRGASIDGSSMRTCQLPCASTHCPNG